MILHNFIGLNDMNLPKTQRYIKVGIRLNRSINKLKIDWSLGLEKEIRAESEWTRVLIPVPIPACFSIVQITQ